MESKNLSPKYDKHRLKEAYINLNKKLKDIKIIKL